MKICFLCDLHLPFDQNALQYDVLEWAIADIGRKKPDCIVYAGDVTCDGNLDTYQWFVESMQRLDLPFLFIPGNSDLRCREYCHQIKKICSACKHDFGGVTIFAVNDCDATVSEEQFALIETADETSIVFMHHPIDALAPEYAQKMLEWRKTHKDTRLFYGHLHETKVEENNIALQAMDPDKAIGECPCITYYDTDTKNLRKAYYFSPIPNDLEGYFGISCYDTISHIDFCTKHGLKHLELRPNCLSAEESELAAHIANWREVGGETLCIHLPDVVYRDGVAETQDLERFMQLANRLHADRFTQHVPCVSVSTTKSEPHALERICDYLAEAFNTVEHEMVIGVENMHMTAAEAPDDTRRFGYLPEECLTFMTMLGDRCKHKIGINFDIGHARNNAPFSQTYQISTWLSQLGKHVVGYHIHQVTLTDGTFNNHMPITDVYGSLISYASFFKYWSFGRINKAPLIFEMRPQGAYETTLKTFSEQKIAAFDLHTHTYYSGCGKDDPHDLIETAIEHGVSLLGICDHSYGIGARKARYLQEMRALADEYRDRITLLCGIEIATIPENFDIEDPAEIKDYDYCLIEHITYDDSIVGKELFQFCKRLGILCGVAHTDLFEYCDKYGFAYEEFFAQMAKNNVFWEMNVSYDSIHNYHEHQYVLDFMSDPKKADIVRNAGVIVSIGSDCHDCEEYDGFRLQELYRFLKNTGIKMFDKRI